MIKSKTKELNYIAVRGKIKSGDVFLYKGTQFGDRLLQGWQGSEYNHTGLAVWWNKRLMVFEAAPSRGVIVRPLSASVRQFPGVVDWFTSKQPLSPAKRQRMMQFAQLELGKEYSRWEAFLLGLRDFLSRLRERGRLPLNPTNKTFCSYYVSQVYGSVGIDLVRKKSDRDTYPDDIARSRLLVYRGSLSHVPQINIVTAR